MYTFSVPYHTLNARFIAVLLVSFFFSLNYQPFGKAQTALSKKKDLSISFTGDAKIEAGSYSAGLSFHHSFPVPQRISFYYPSANSIDNSTDYWYRDSSAVTDIGIRFGSGQTEWLNKTAMQYEATPFSVFFHRNDDKKNLSINYQFTGNKPAFVVTYTIKNNTTSAQPLQLLLRHSLSLKTSHTFRRKLPAGCQLQDRGQTVTARFADGETQNPVIFVLTSRQPSFCQFVPDSSSPDTLTALRNGWNSAASPAVNYLFSEVIEPGDSYQVSEIIGSSTPHEYEQLCKLLHKNYRNEITAFEESVLEKIYSNATFTTGDSYLDPTVRWSLATLETSRHYINGSVQPMPCPAEYNFYFTHDVLLTDLAAVKFDIKRVRNDLLFIASRANADKIIPHAYYWKDSTYVTEFADHDNWNNFWFIITCAEYLKHSSDTATIRMLYPYAVKSLEQALLTRGEDDLMWSKRPDWWDIGTRFGQRSYMTILAIKAIRSYLAIAQQMNINEVQLSGYETLQQKMHTALISKLWSDKHGYLMNNSDPDVLDEHFYCGSLLAPHYGLLDSVKIQRTISGATASLLDKKVGISVVAPMDFHELGDFWHFAGNEAGAKYYYINGGVWPHANAWYALSLIAGNMRDSAFQFIKSIMTVKGVMEGPNGQPAMYEVRNANHEDPKSYGTIDKPQFMWSAGWYLYSLYALFGVEDNEWNITLNPYLQAGQQRTAFTLCFNNTDVQVTINRTGSAGLQCDGKDIYSYVLPHTMKAPKQIHIGIGTVAHPLLKRTNSQLESISTSSKHTATLVLRAFTGHKNITEFSCIQKPVTVLVDGTPAQYTYSGAGQSGQLLIRFTHSKPVVKLNVEF